MANNCMTEVVVLGPQEQIDKLYGIMDTLEKSDRSSGHGCDRNWLGNIISALGGDPEKIYCRGLVVYHDRRDNDSMEFCCDSAWREPYEFFDFLREKLPDIDIYFCAEEPGCEYYVTNDATGMFYPARFIAEELGDETEYFETEENLLKWAKERWNIDAASFDELYKAVYDDENKVVVKYDVVA